ncbi:unnamed protein product [Candidula unifasciata]|uniref:Lipocalin/cytosolic fatty-acid binding domain-containing protein n=1 Tax=Candidula unifasciata TaxID=100452 RepID=A0A8S3ZC11_9EUPU|nr:unnamed protein product [Candidula unifasciata]
MVDKLLGHWKLENSDNLEEYMKAMKVNIILRKVAKTLTNYEEISREGDTWTLHITSTFKNSKVVFKIGEPFKDNTLDGRYVLTTFTIEDDVLIETQEPLNKSHAPSRFERKVLEDGRMCLTCIATEENVVAKRYHQPYTP